jgi:hypothetical protein
MEPGWGSLAPTANEDSPSKIPFRPAVATAFLYTPLLAWDLNTLAGAVFSSILVNEQLPDSEDMFNCARLLITGRVIQTLITPHGFDSIDGMEIDEEDEEGRWDPAEMQMESEAMAKLYSHCRARVLMGSMDSEGSLKKDPSEVSSPVNLFGNVGRSVLPFARSVILMMRACDAAVKNRLRKRVTNAEGSDGSDNKNRSSKILEGVLSGTETMTTNDGMFILKEMEAPLPSTIIDESGDWWRLVNRWLTASIALEKHHGSRGKSILPELYSPRAHEEDNDQKMAVADSPSELPASDESDVTAFQGTSASGAFDGSRPGAGISDSDTRNNTYGDELGQNDSPMGRRYFSDGIADESDDELVEDMDMDDAEEMVDFADQVAGIAGIAGAAAGNDGEESADEPSSSGSDNDGESNDTSYLFAGVGQSPIISYQPSLLAQQSIGPGKQGSMFEAAAASSVMADLSHLGLIHRKDSPTFSLIRLPKSFVELYGVVNKVKGRDESSTLEDADDVGNSETAICLLTGAVMRSGSNRRSFHRTQRPPGACTLHARKNGSGIGIFFLVQKCTVLLMHNNKSAYSPSIYVDEHGEEDPGLRRGRPLFLNDTRYRALEKLWRQQGIPREVAQIRSTSDRVIRDNWY